jgi:hypothetical protein
MSWGERWFLLILVELLTIIQCIEVRGDFCWYWWNWFHQYQQKSPLTSTHWVMVNNSTNIKKITSHLNSLTITQWIEVRGDFCWYWWNCWPSLNEFRWEVILVYFVGIVDHHSMSWSERWFLLILVELLTITEWWSTIPPISTKITSHLITLSDGQQFHQYQQKTPLTLTHWVMVNNPR